MALGSRFSDSRLPPTRGGRQSRRASPRSAAARRRDLARDHPSVQIDMKVRLSPKGENRALQWLADVHEKHDLIRHPTGVQLLGAVEEAGRRADSLARLEHALQRAPLP